MKSMKKRPAITVLDEKITPLINLCQVSMEVEKAANFTPESEIFSANYSKGEAFDVSVIQDL